MGKLVSLEIPNGSLVIDGAKISPVIGRVGDQIVLRPEDARSEDHCHFYMTVQEILHRQQDLKFQIRFSMSSYLTGAATPQTLSRWTRPIRTRFCSGLRHFRFWIG